MALLPGPAGLQRPRVHVVHPVIPPLLEPDQAEVLCTIRKRLALPAVVAVVAKEAGGGRARDCDEGKGGGRGQVRHHGVGGQGPGRDLREGEGEDTRTSERA